MRQMRPVFVVFLLPTFQFASKILPIVEHPSSVELFGIGLVSLRGAGHVSGEQEKRGGRLTISFINIKVHKLRVELLPPLWAGSGGQALRCAPLAQDDYPLRILSSGKE